MSGQDIEAAIEDFRSGYPRFCALINEVPAFNVFRRFSKLRIRLILKKQDRLSLLEKQLDRLDREEPVQLFLASNELDDNDERLTLLGRIETTLQEYDDLVRYHTQTLNAPNARSRDVASLRNWTIGTRCLARVDHAYLSHRDLFSAAEQDSALAKVESIIEDFMIRYFVSFYRRWCTRRSRDSNVYIPAEAWITYAARILIAVAVILALLIPILICSYVTSARTRLLIVAAAIVICINVLVITVRVRTIEIIVAGITYATVLTVFVTGTGAAM